MISLFSGEISSKFNASWILRVWSLPQDWKKQPNWWECFWVCGNLLFQWGIEKQAKQGLGLCAFLEKSKLKISSEALQSSFRTSFSTSWGAASSIPCSVARALLGLKQTPVQPSSVWFRGVGLGDCPWEGNESSPHVRMSPVLSECELEGISVGFCTLLCKKCSYELVKIICSFESYSTTLSLLIDTHVLFFPKSKYQYFQYLENCFYSFKRKHFRFSFQIKYF